MNLSCLGHYDILSFSILQRALLIGALGLGLSAISASVVWHSLRRLRAYSDSVTFLFVGIVFGGAVLAYSGSLPFAFISPDETEAVFGAKRFLTQGQYAIDINGTIAPPRYLPWFPIVLLAPGLLVIPLSVIGIIPALYFGLLLGVIFLLSLALSRSALTGVLTAIIVALLPSMPLAAQHIQTHIPAALFSALGFLWILLNSTRSLSWGKALIPGTLLAASVACRPVYAAFLIPLMATVWTIERQRVRTVIAVVVPTFVVSTATMAYQYLTFGSLLRSGYHFWLPAIHDRLGNTFGIRFITENLQVFVLFSGAALLLACIGIFRGIAHRLDLQSSALLSPFFTPTIILACLGIVLFHLLYFYPSEIYFLPVNLVLAVYAGLQVSPWLELRFPKATVVRIATGGFLVALFAFHTHDSTIASIDSAWIDQIKGMPGPRVELITEHDPAYIRALAGEHVFLFSRENTAEYYSKIQDCIHYRASQDPT